MSVSGLADAFAFTLQMQIQIKPYLGVSGNGTRQYGPVKSYPCLVQEDQKPIFTASGQQVVSTSTILVYPVATDGTVLAALNADAQIILPDGTAPRLLRAGSVPDFGGATIYWRLLT